MDFGTIVLQEAFWLGFTLRVSCRGKLWVLLPRILSSR